MQVEKANTCKKIWSLRAVVRLNTKLHCHNLSLTAYRNEEIIPANRLTQTTCIDPPQPAATIRTCTDKQRTFFVPTGAESRNLHLKLNLPALYAYPNTLRQVISHVHF